MSIALCFSTENKSLFHYTNMPFTAACVFNGKTLLANQYGLFEMGGSTDNGTPIIAKMKTAASSLGTQQRKRVPTSKVYIEADKQGGSIDLAVTVDGETSHYNSGDAEFQHFAPLPIKIGRGLDGTHWQIEVKSNDCDRLSIDSIEFEPMAIRRRGK